MRNILFCVLLFCAYQTLSQSQNKIQESLLMTSHPLDDEADYSYLVNTSKVSFDIPVNWDVRLVKSFNKTIKIYNERGLDKANISIPLWKNKRNREYLEKLVVRIHKLENNEIQSKKIDVEKYKEENEDVILIKFAIPNIAVGDIIELKYVITSPYVTILPRYYFQHEVPVDSAQYTIDVPGYFSLSPNLKGYLDIQVTDKKLSQSNHYEKRYMLKANNIKPFKNPTYILDTDDYRSSIKYEMVSYQIPGQSENKLSSTWQDVADHFWHEWKIKKAIRYSSKKIDADDFSSIKDTLEKVESIIEYIHQNYAWNNEYLSQSPNLKELLKKKSGNIIDLHTLLVNLLQNNGIESSILLTRLRHHGLINDKFPSRGNFNNALTYVEIGSGYLLIDLSDANLDLGQISLSSRNFSGLLINGNREAKFIYYNTNNKYKKTTQAKYTINEDNTIDAYKKEILTNSAKSSYINNPKNYLPKTASLINSVEIERNEPIILEYTNENDESLIQIENTIIIPTCINCPIQLLSLESKDRDYPIIVPYKTKQSYIYQLDINDGWRVQSKPEDEIIKNPNAQVQLTYAIKENKKKLVVSILYEIKKEVFQPGEYNKLRYAIQKMKKKLEENIVLAKI